MKGQFKKQYFFCYILVTMKSENKIVFAFLTAWCSAIILTPISELFFSGNLFSGFTFLFFEKLCHQISERSFSIYGNYFPVCSRCTSIYFSFYFGFILILILPKLQNILNTKLIFAISFLPMFFDVALNFFGIHQSNFFTRIFTGSVAGFGLSLLLFKDFPIVVKYFNTKKGILFSND